MLFKFNLFMHIYAFNVIFSVCQNWYLSLFISERRLILWERLGTMNWIIPLVLLLTKRSASVLKASFCHSHSAANPNRIVCLWSSPSVLLCKQNAIFCVEFVRRCAMVYVFGRWSSKHFAIVDNVVLRPMARGGRRGADGAVSYWS